MTIYRVYGGDAPIAGRYWTLESPTNREAWREDYAVLDEWSNTGSELVSYTVKAEDNVGGWVGTAAPQTSRETGEILSGGKEQIFIDLRGKDLTSLELPNGWEG